MDPRRGFEQITVKALGHQSGRDRYPRKYVEDNEIEVPKCAAWGMNLTALSQVYNMYIVAYGSKIHIYKPTGPQQLLTTEPLLILDLPSTPKADRLRARDPYSTHSINHLIVGNLGTREIILCACADGDVLAYYTTPIHHASLTPRTTTSSTPPLPAQPQPTPFFHEFVEISAWGLAIHTQSRLIAVSSNAHEVQVFAFALASTHWTWNPMLYFNMAMDAFPTLTPPPSSPPSRSHNFRLRLRLGTRGDNIPSIAFTSTPKGEADSIVASDIKGALWFLPLWRRGEPTRVPTAPGGVNWRREPQGWGVVVLDNKFGRRARGVEGALGCVPAEGKGVWDISRSIGEVRGGRVGTREAAREAAGFIAWGYGAGGGFDVGEAEGVDLGLYWGDLLDDDGMGDDEFVGDEGMDNDLDDGDDDDGEEEESDAPATDSPAEPVHVPVPSHHLILHLNRHALTLYPPTGRPTFCSPLLRQDYSHTTASFSHPMEFYNRLNMAVPVPGLSCVVIGSQVGRVGIVRVMKGGIRGGMEGKEGNGGKNAKNGEGIPPATMRLETILPFSSQEGRNRARPATGLHGMAVSPMPDWLPGQEGASSDEGGDGRRKRGVKRWRLMMQFWDLTVLSYVLSDERGLEAEGL